MEETEMLHTSGDEEDTMADDGRATDVRYRLTECLLAGERRYLASVRSLEHVYGTPLRKLSSISAEEHRQLFTGIQPVCSVSAMLISKLESTLDTWDSETTRVGGLFSKQLIHQYEEYLKFHQTARRLYRQKQATDEEFVEFCRLRRGAAKHTLDALLLLPVQRLAQYERYFQDLLAETPSDHPDADDLSRVRGRVKQLLSTPGNGQSELERVQELFPSDDLGLFCRDPSSQRMKGLIRKRSAPTSRLQRALSAKAQRPSSAERSPAGTDDDKENSEPPGDVTDAPARRQFVMETAVQFTVGAQSQDRHLFLFTDMLLVAKARSGGNFKLKEKVRLSEMWLAGCLDDVAEVAKDPATSFVIGWPTTNVVVTFSGPARDLWYNKLSQLIAAEREHEAKATAIHVLYRDPGSNSDLGKTVTAGSSATARDCVRSALSSLDLPSAVAAEYQLWARPAADEPPYPLIGHELPAAIQLHALREAATEERAEMDHCNNIYSTSPTAGCQFILRPVRSDLRALSPSPDPAKKKKLSKKSPIRIHNVFRRTNSKPDCVDAPFSVCGSPMLFGQPLSTLCQNDTLPPPVLAMLIQLFRKGPYTVGIFRKSANARVVKEIKEKLDSGLEVDMESVNIYAVAGLTKDFLRSLPDPLLGSELYDEWREVADIEDEHDKIIRIRELCSRLPAANVTLLCHFLCVLHHVARRSHHNLMSAANVAVCVGPSLLTPACPTQALASDSAKRLPAVVALLIERCDAIFGSECLRLLGPPPGRAARTDSGEDSDGLASGGGVRRDDSSIDSLERELLGENEPLPRKDKMAVTNLSRDSGLTLSDTQLYALDDEEESASTSSGQSVEKSEHSACSSGRGSDNSYRHRPVDGSTIYASPRRPSVSRESPEAVYARPPPPRHTPSNFKRQDWTRQHHPARRSGRPGFDPKSSLRRSASEESLVKMCGPREPARPTPEPESRPSPSRSPPMVRSRSAHHLAQRRDARLAPAPPRDTPPAPSSAWARSRSTPHIDDADRSYDSSTLSDDDSTPHVSRSNSRSKDCSLANDLWERTYGAVESRADPRADARFVRGSSVSSSRSGSCVETPPSYDATLSRRQRLTPSNGRSAIYALPEQVLREQTILSNRAKQLYEESLRIYAQQTAAPEMVYASPVRTVSGGGGPAPPLPPKQRSPTRRPDTGRRGPDQPSTRTVIQIGDSDSTAPRACRPQRRASRREAETQTEVDSRAEPEERRRRPHVTLVEIEATPRCPRPGDAAESWADADVGWSVSRLRELFSGDGSSGEQARYRHPPLRRAGGSGGSGSSSPGDIYASLPPPRLAPLGRTVSAASSNDGEESYV
ncbi:rho GTPase-activating protein 20-like [Amphibalanus amphitrite]|uniref:rho GTPase-activating protein 20-like n=1 Tax=Amphibalanus amphitrite TaxID=1232801 RepID=UPI001C8FCC19|nr:rho GTPase-activating protein 20-like [Amphibalanus amphitrite]